MTDFPNVNNKLVPQQTSFQEGREGVVFGPEKTKAFVNSELDDQQWTGAISMRMQRGVTQRFSNPSCRKASTFSNKLFPNLCPDNFPKSRLG